VWQKWSDPLGEDDIEDIKIFEPEFYDDENDDYEKNIPNNKNNTKHNFYERPTKVIVTPMGIIPYTENTSSNKIFNFWIGHTNFNITTHVASIIELTDGVETLDVFTRYRFRIGIGKLFDAPTVMNSISKEVLSFLEI
jgi:hypothetical protein